MVATAEAPPRRPDRTRWLAWQWSRPCPWWGWLVLAVGVVGLTGLGSLLYGGSAARRGSIGDTLFVAVALGVGMAAVVWLSHCRKALVTMTLALAVAWSSFIGGHLVGYRDAPNMAAAYFDAHPGDIPAHAPRDPSSLLASYVDLATGRTGASFFSYLRLQMAAGAETRRTMRGHGSYTITVSGLGVLLMWLVQVVLMPIATLVGTVAATPGLNDEPPASFAAPVKPRST